MLIKRAVGSDWGWDPAVTEGETDADSRAERIRGTAVSIDALNGPYAGGLGRGRIDLLRALASDT